MPWHRRHETLFTTRCTLLQRDHFRLSEEHTSARWIMQQEQALHLNSSRFPAADNETRLCFFGSWNGVYCFGIISVRFVRYCRPRFCWFVCLLTWINTPAWFLLRSQWTKRCWSCLTGALVGWFHFKCAMGKCLPLITKHRMHKDFFFFNCSLKSCPGCLGC